MVIFKVNRMICKGLSLNYQATNNKEFSPRLIFDETALFWGGNRHSVCFQNTLINYQVLLIHFQINYELWCQALSVGIQF